MPGKKREPNEIRVVNEKPREYVPSFAPNPLEIMPIHSSVASARFAVFTALRER